MASGPKKGSLSLLWVISLGSRWLYMIAFVFMILTIACNYLLPQVIRFVVDHVVGGEPLPDVFLLRVLVENFGGVPALRQNLVSVGVFTVGIALAGGVSNFVYHRCLAKGSEGVIKRLRDRLYNHIQSLPFEWHTKTLSGDIIQRCTSDVDVVRNFITNQLLEMLRTIILVVLAYSIMFPMNFAMSLASFVFLPVIFSYSFFFLMNVSDRFRKADEAEGVLLSIAQENFASVRVVRAFGRERFEVDRFDKQNHLFSDLWIGLGNLLSSYWGLGDLITGLQMITICVAGAWQASLGRITVGGFIVFLTYNSMIIWPVRGLGRILSEASKTGVSLGRLREILDTEPERDPEDALEIPVEGDITFEHVSFSYDGKKVLDDVSFTVKQGTTLGILGSTGSGKTTAAYLLCRLHDLKEGEGRITIGGVDIRRFKRGWLRKNVGIVLQEPFLFSRTIRENVASFSSQYTIDEIREASRVSCVDDTVSGFAMGYDTIVGERGVTLSGGQKQRVAIARTVLRQPPIMIFDDSLSSVDTETDAKIRQALATRTKGATTILIAHRITSISAADNILVMGDGNILEEGTHQELIALGGNYCRVHDMQESLDTELERAVKGV